MHKLKEKLWSELVILATKEDERTKEGKDMEFSNVQLIKETAKAYVYLCKAEKLHHEYKHEHRMLDVAKMYDHPMQEKPVKEKEEEEVTEHPKMFQ